MDPMQWERVKEVFDAALQREPGERRAFVEPTCVGDEAICDEVLSLLAAFDRADSFTRIFPNRAVSMIDAELFTLPLGQRVGSYEVLREIGRGGMGAVYLATRADEEYNKRVAIKLVQAGSDRNAIIERFRHERQTLAALDHPNIVKLLDGGTTTDGVPFLVMDYVEGAPVDEYCDAHRLSTTERIRLFLGICAAVQYAHQNLIVHRDLKPSNILVTVDGVPKLLDFGIAKVLDPWHSSSTIPVTRTTERLMTLEYASPEQVRGEPITTASDVYALGVILYRLLTGRHPYQLKTNSAVDIERVICEVDPEKPSTAVTAVETAADLADRTEQSHASPTTTEAISDMREGTPDRLRRRLAGDLDTIVLMALRKEPRRRYGSVEQFADDLRRHLENRPVLARRATWTYLAAKFTRRHTAAVVAASLALLSALGGVAATTRETFIARAEKSRAERRFDDVRNLAQSMFQIHDAIQNLNGATPARRLIVSTAVEYLDRLTKEAAGDTSLQAELADGYLKVGDVQGYPYRANLGDVAGALDSYHKSRLIAEGIVRIDPQSAAGRWLLARSEGRTGAALMQRGDTAGAVKVFRQALAIYEPLAASDRNNLQLRQDMAVCYDSLGDALGSPAFLSQRDTPAAVVSYRRALAIDEEITAVDPSHRRARRGVAVELTKIGDMLAMRFENTPALESYRKALASFTSLADADKNNADLLRSVEIVHGRMAEVLTQMDDIAGALENTRKESAIAEALVDRDRENALAQHDMAVSLKRMGGLHFKHGDLSYASADYRRLLPIAERFSGDASNAQWRPQFAEMLVAIGKVQAKAGQMGEARQSTSLGLSTLNAIVGRSDVGSEELNIYASALLTCEPAALRDQQAALRHAERAAALSQSKNAAVLDTLALAYFETGDPERAVTTEKRALALLPSAVAGEATSATVREYQTHLARYSALQNRARTSEGLAR